MRVLIIPEDFRNDQYMLKPIITAMFSELGKPKAIIRVCQDPLLHGVSEAMKWENLEEIFYRYKGMVDIFLLCVDRDGNINRKEGLDNLEQKAKTALSHNTYFLAENAWQEIEVWVLAGHTLPRNWIWQDIRQEINPKEKYFEPFAKSRGLLYEPGGGRKTLATEAAKRYPRIKQLCPEDIANLESRIQ